MFIIYLLLMACSTSSVVSRYSSAATSHKSGAVQRGARRYDSANEDKSGSDSDMDSDSDQDPPRPGGVNASALEAFVAAPKLHTLVDLTSRMIQRAKPNGRVGVRRSQTGRFVDMKPSSGCV